MRVVASGAVVAAPREIDGCTEPWAIDSGPFHYVDNTKCGGIREHHHHLFVNDTVVELGKLGTVPTVGSAHEIAGNALQLVNM